MKTEELRKQVNEIQSMYESDLLTAEDRDRIIKAIIDKFIEELLPKNK